MRTVILTPFRTDNGRRALIWAFVQRWIAEHYDHPIHVGNPEGRFGAAAARNAAAAAAGDWDMAIIHDADTIAHPAAVHAAVELAARSGAMVIAGDSHMYLDQRSSDRILASGDPAFARPVSFDEHGIYTRPCSGVFAVSRETFDRAGGYIEACDGWGYEDLAFLQCCGIWAGGNDWVPGHITLHLWHPPSPRTEATDRNREVWQALARYRRLADRDGARRYLARLGHRVP